MDNTNTIKLFETFESIKEDLNGVEVRSARRLQKILGYKEWRNFQNALGKAKESCNIAGYKESDHFVDINKSIISGKGATSEISDIILSRYACYLIAQNGDPSKSEIAFAQSYFAVQTRQFEIIQQRIKERERLNARQKQSLTEKDFHKIAFERGVDGPGISRIISKGDKILFGGNTTADMKKTLSVPDNRALADFLPTVTIKAKDLATEMTNFNTQQKDLVGERAITDEHQNNNAGVRKLLKERDIIPEQLGAEEDIKKLERRLTSEQNTSLGIKQKKIS